MMAGRTATVLSPIFGTTTSGAFVESATGMKPADAPADGRGGGCSVRALGFAAPLSRPFRRKPMGPR